jgi:Holliday junction resolvase RusA-like endonuclease
MKQPQTCISFVINAAPVPKGRPRFSRQHNTRNVVAYTPKRTRDYEAQVLEAAKPHFAEIITEPCHIYIKVVFPRPQRLKAKRFPDGLIPHDKRPDLDNLAKAVMDGIGPLMTDDALITKMTASKFYSERGGEARTYVTLITNHDTEEDRRHDTTIL